MIRLNHQSLAAVAAFLFGAVSLNLQAATFSDDNWTALGGYPGVDDSVRATAVDASGNLYIAGPFTIAGAVFANNVAKWNGTNWSALGSGLQSDDGSGAIVYALAVSGHDLYAAGHFTTAGGVAANSIAKWNGTNWSPLGLGITGGGPDSGLVYGLAVSGHDVYASGSFTLAGGNPANHIAKWNGSSWSALGSGLNDSAGAVAVSGSDLYVGGSFTAAGGIPANQLAKWDGTSWSALGSGIEGVDYRGNPFTRVSALTLSGNDLYVAGIFSTAGGVAATNMAKWNGSSWTAFPWPIYGAEEEAFSGWVNTLTISGNDLYAAGTVEVGNMWVSSYAAYVVKWNGSSWSPLGPGISGSWYDGWDPSVAALAVSGTNVYAGGAFTEADGKSAHCIARWNGSNWSSVSAARISVSQIAASTHDAYGVVSLVAADGTTTDFLAKWNGSGWSRVGTGAVDVINMAVSGRDLYAFGSFTNVGITANIARWDGSKWSALGSGVNGSAALAVSGTNVYAAGQFTMAGGIPANNVAKWNGSSWSPLGSGLESSDGNVVFVSARAASGDALFVAGRFTRAGGIAATNMAQWNGSSWVPFGSGLETIEHGPSPVSALVVLGSQVYAGGGGNTFEIARWDGNNWSAIGSFEHYNGDGPDVWALAASSKDLYVGGWFKQGEAYNLARWDGSSWSALASGVNGRVHQLAVTDTELFAAGSFTTAGGKVSPYHARARIGSVAKAVTSSNGTASIRFSGVTGYPYDVQRTTSLKLPIVWTTVTTTPVYPAADGAFTFTDPNTPPGSAYYRAQAIDSGP